MMRSAAVRSVGRRAKQTARLYATQQTPQTNVTGQPTPPPKPSGGGGGKFLSLLFAAGGAASFFVYYKRDEEPYKSIYESVAGKSTPEEPIKPLAAATSSTAKPKETTTIKQTESKKPDAPKPKSPVAVVADKQTDTEKDEKTKREIETIDNDAKIVNSQFEERVKQSLQSVDKKVKEALAAKDRFAESIVKNAKELKRNVDRIEPSEAADAILEEVRHAHAKAQQLAHDAGADAKNYLGQLKMILNEGRADVKTKSNALIANVQATIDNLEAQMEVVDSKVRRADIESRIINEYKTQLRDARRRFADELESIAPNVNATSLKNVENLSKNDLNAYIAHAHVKVDELRRQFIEYQLRAEQKLSSLLEQERAENEANYQQRLKAEVQKINSEQNALLESRLSKERAKFEDELRNQMRRQAAAHSKHIEEVLAAYKQQCDVETATKIKDAVSAERDEFYNIQQASLQRLQTIEEALDARKQQDAENRRSRELWLACQNLLESIVHGRKAEKSDQQRRAPLANQLIVIREHCNTGDDAVLTQLFDAFSDEALHSGVYTETDLKARFDRVAALCRRTALLENEEVASTATLYTYLLSALQSLLVFPVTDRKYSPDERLDLEHPPSTHQLIDRARYHVAERRDLAAAIRLLLLLQGEPARVARSWIEDARKHVETRQTAELLLAHAAAQSLRTHY